MTWCARLLETRVFYSFLPILQTRFTMYSRWIITLPAGAIAKHCNECVCLYVHVSVREHISRTTCESSSNFYACCIIFTFIHQKCKKNKNIGTWCKEYTKWYKLARYLQRNVRASWLALRLTFGLYLPNIPWSCVTERSLNNKRNVFFVAEKACRNLAVLIFNCDSMGKKLKFCWHFLTTAGDPVRKIFIKRRFTVNSKDRLSRESSGHASVPCNRMGKHLACSKASTHSSEAARPTLL